jgi:hypothetical protein
MFLTLLLFSRFTFAYKNGLFNDKPNPYGVFKSSISGGDLGARAPILKI